MALYRDTVGILLRVLLAVEPALQCVTLLFQVAEAAGDSGMLLGVDGQAGEEESRR